MNFFLIINIYKYSLIYYNIYNIYNIYLLILIILTLKLKNISKKFPELQESI